MTGGYCNLAVTMRCKTYLSLCSFQHCRDGLDTTVSLAMIYHNSSLISIVASNGDFIKEWPICKLENPYLEKINWWCDRLYGLGAGLGGPLGGWVNDTLGWWVSPNLWIAERPQFELFQAECFLHAGSLICVSRGVFNKLTYRRRPYYFSALSWSQPRLTSSFQTIFGIRNCRTNCVVSTF